METTDFKNSLDAIYRDMRVRIELGLIDMESDVDFQNQLWEAVAEKLPDRVPEEQYAVNLFSVVLGAISERILREYFTERGGDWW